MKMPQAIVLKLIWIATFAYSRWVRHEEDLPEVVMSTDIACPYCGDTMYAEFVDVGVGGPGQQVAPYYCDSCLSYQRSPYRSDGVEEPLITPDEKRTGMYEPPDGPQWLSTNGPCPEDWR